MRRNGRDVLRPTPAATTDPLATACFPLVPYANRIAHGRFAFGGEAHALPLNFGDHPHSLHGIGWQRRWQVAEAIDHAATLVLSHPGGGDWPWRFSATQRFELDDNGLAATLTVRNDDDLPMPAGLGFHPCFPIDEHSRLTFSADRMWRADATMLPTEPAPAATHAVWATGAPVRPFLDNAFEGWTGEARLDDTCLSAQGAPWLHVFIPEGQRQCCIEPVSHGPDAINRGGMSVLAPGEQATLAMRIGVS